MYHSICLVSRDRRRVAGLGVAHRELPKSCRELQGRVNASRGPFRLVTQISTIVLASCRWLARKLPNNDVNSSSRPRSFHCNRMAGLNSCGRTCANDSQADITKARITGWLLENTFVKVIPEAAIVEMTMPEAAIAVAVTVAVANKRLRRRLKLTERRFPSPWQSTVVHGRLFRR
ncbi:uncharacterized protein CC84DRAFT_1176163 [Paraphaeosphaeria sporulosa]|uniref:Uncharacterized protein n=1 Tax=Paraphaeosphaeria sporulosa TaxID=1460663 RepID=A0A177CEP0_9PLEO|nr:uncharacterized protein CC84DRAFT_1176163 [Paraphaeosphaeria sporulosa]OAG06104.1 hypothetical protein CC84DRAFT_1176163 [Paraphaeosphaeria sporulosa]